MKQVVDDEFIAVCRDILFQGKTLDEWAQIEADDMFQTEKYVGGFDGTEMEFCFSAYINEKEYWFQLSLQDIRDVVAGKLAEYEMREADT